MMNTSQQHDAQAAIEREFLSSIAVDPKIMRTPEVANVRAEDFDNKAHQIWFAALRQMQAERRPLDIVTIKTYLKSEGLEESVGGSGYVYRVLSENCTAAHYAYHADLICKHGKNKRAFMLLAAATARAEAGEDADTVLQFARDGIKDLTSESADDVDLLTAAELDSGNFDLDYYTENVLVVGQPCIMAAAQKAMKTSLAIELGISVAMGIPFLGTFRTRQAEVLILSGESGTATIQETARRICLSKGINLSDLPHFHFSPWIPRLNDSRSLATLSRTLETTQAKVVFLDPAYLMMTGDDANNLFKQGAELRRLSEVCSEAGTTPVLIHHNKKSTGAEANALPELSHIAWSGFAEFARQWILLSRREPCEPGTGEHRLWLVTGGSAGHGGAWGLDIFEGTRETVGGRVWETHLAPAGQIRQVTREAALNAKEAKRDDAKRAIEDAHDSRVRNVLTADGQWKTCSEIRTATKMNADNTKAALVRLCETGQAELGKKTINGREFDAYRPSVVQHCTPMDKPPLTDGGSVGRTKAPLGGFVHCPTVIPENNAISDGRELYTASEEF